MVYLLIILAIIAIALVFESWLVFVFAGIVIALIIASICLSEYEKKVLESKGLQVPVNNNMDAYLWSLLVAAFVPFFVGFIYIFISLPIYIIYRFLKFLYRVRVNTM